MQRRRLLQRRLRTPGRPISSCWSSSQMFAATSDACSGTRRARMPISGSAARASYTWTLFCARTRSRWRRCGRATRRIGSPWNLWTMPSPERARRAHRRKTARPGPRIRWAQCWRGSPGRSLDLERQANALRARLSPPTARLLDLLARRNISPPVAALENSACGECHVRLPTALANAMVRGSTAHRCPHCKRILVPAPASRLASAV